MDLHEFQSKGVLGQFGLPILPGFLCYTPGEVEAAANRLAERTGSPICVVKAQVQAGGRGKAGGVKLAKSAEEARSHGESILGMTLITPQTGAKGKKVHKVYVEAGCAIEREFYLSFLLDRASRCITIIASSEGGTEVEEVAEHSPEKIIKIFIDPSIGLQPFHTLEVISQFKLSGNGAKNLTEVLLKLYEAFLRCDFSLVEINPLVLTKQGEIILLDAKCSVDDNALYRQPGLKVLLDYDENDPKDLKAAKFGLSYVALDGNIGCMVNGAGLAMATMDTIAEHGGKPANFLDVGGGASKETVTEAFKILLSDAGVKAIFVNIFGGIMKCDVIAEGIISAAKELAVKVPLIVRLQGTNVELGRKLLSESGLQLTPAESIDEAARLAVAAAR
jgi:succinyl-CoA synthetase beta subunit